MTEEPSQQATQSGPPKASEASTRGLWPTALARDFWPLALAGGAALVLAYSFVRAESPCYWSDFNYYEWATRLSARLFESQPLTFPLLVLASATRQVNLFYTVPLLPVMELLGGGRFAYIASTTLVYFLPLVYVIARLARTISVKPALSLGRMMLVILTIPVLWAPELRGYPDCGAALCLMLSLLIYLCDRSLQNPKQGAKIGVLLTLTVLIRRYFAYAGIALVVAICVDQFALIWQDRKKAKGERELTASESTATESTAAESATAESAIAESATAESATAESATAESATAESATAESTASESATAESTASESATAESATAESTASESATAESATAESPTAKLDSDIADGASADSAKQDNAAPIPVARKIWKLVVLGASGIFSMLILGKKRIWTLAVLGASGVASMLILGYGFLQTINRLDFLHLYESYRCTPLASFGYFISCYGLFIISLSVCGLIQAWRKNLIDKGKAIFVIGFFLLTWTLWLHGPCELATHYTLYVSPIVALGVVLFFDALSSGSSVQAAKKWMLPLAYTLMVFNFCLSLAPARIGDMVSLTLFRPGMLNRADQEGKGPAIIFSASYPPYIREDISTLKTIIDLFGPHYGEAPTSTQNAPDDRPKERKQDPLSRRDRVGIACGGSLFNGETLHNLERSIYGRENDKIDWLEMPAAISKDTYALERLLACNYVIVPSQVQYFIATEGQKVLTAIKVCFDEKWPLAQDFKQLPTTYTIDGGLKLTVYERIRPTDPQTAALTLGKMRDYVGKPDPYSQPDWITTGQMSQVQYDQARTIWPLYPGLPRTGVFGQESRYMLYDRDLPASFKVSGRATTAGQMPGLSIKLSVLGENGQPLDQTIFSRDAAKLRNSPAELPFSYEFKKRPATEPQPKYLLLLFDFGPGTFAQDSCLTMDSLKVEPR